MPIFPRDGRGATRCATTHLLDLLEPSVRGVCSCRSGTALPEQAAEVWLISCVPQRAESMRKTLEHCDVDADVQHFVRDHQTGTVRPGTFPSSGPCHECALTASCCSTYPLPKLLRHTWSSIAHKDCAAKGQLPDRATRFDQECLANAKALLCTALQASCT